jgi:hypothetical protein
MQQAVPMPVVLQLAEAMPQAQVPPLQVPKQQSSLVLQGPLVIEQPQTLLALQVPLQQSLPRTQAVPRGMHWQICGRPLQLLLQH